MLILRIVLLAAAALIAIGSAYKPEPRTLWIAVVLLCVLFATLLVGGG
jgi:hypothetical protein